MVLIIESKFACFLLERWPKPWLSIDESLESFLVRLFGALRVLMFFAFFGQVLLIAMAQLDIQVEELSLSHVFERFEDDEVIG